MKSNPYHDVDDKVKEVVSGLMHGADDYHRSHKARLARTVDLIYRSRPEGVLLEIGTSGLIPVALSQLCPNLEVHVTNFDKSRPLVAPIDLTINAQTVTVTAAAVDLEYDALPFEDATYDHVICCEVLEHMEIDPMFMLGEVNRVSKEGASLLLTTPNVVSSRGLTKMLEGIEPYFFMHYHRTREYHRHNYEYSARSLYRVLMAAGYMGDVWSEDLFEDGLPEVVERLNAAGFHIMNTGDNLIARMHKVSGVVERYPVDIYI